MIVGVIPARWASTRFPGKILAPLCGRPLIQWVVERVAQAESLRRILVATDDQRIADFVATLDVECVMTRADHPSGTDRVAEAVTGTDAGVIVNIQGDEPLIDPELIDALGARLAAGNGWDMATAVTAIKKEEDLLNPSVVKAVFSASGRALYFSRSVIPHVRDAAPGVLPVEHLHWRHLGIYAYTRGFLEKLVATPPCATEQAERLEQLRALHIGGRIHVLPTRHPGPGVDHPEDIAVVEALLAGEQ